MCKRSILSAALCIWFAVGTAWRATVSTSILRQAAGDQIECRVVNVGKTAIQVTSEGVNPDGTGPSKRAMRGSTTAVSGSLHEATAALPAQ